MKIDFNYRFKKLDGEPLPEKTGDKDPFTLRTACVNILLGSEVDSTGRPVEVKGEEKVRRYQLAKTIYESTGLVDLPVEDIGLLKKLIGKIYGPITVGQAWEILDPHAPPPSLDNN